MIESQRQQGHTAIARSGSALQSGATAATTIALVADEVDIRSSNEELGATLTICGALR